MSNTDKNNKEKLCVAAYVFGSYTKYIPYYIYTILFSYPDYFVKIIIDKSVSKKERQALNLLKEKGFDRFEIIENFHPELDFINEMNIVGGGKKILRWLLPYNYFKDFDYVYIGDVDFLILRENIAIHEFHINQMRELGLPFSNMVRKDSEGKSRKRLTGLHFFETDNYYELLNDDISHLINNKKNLMVAVDKVERDESFLYELVKNAINFEDEILMEASRPAHGIHLSIARKDAIELNYPKDVSREKMEEFFADETFRKLIRINPISEIYIVCNELDIKPPYRELYFYYYNNKILFSFRKLTSALRKKLKVLLK